MTDAVSQAEMWARVGRTDRRIDASPGTAAVFFTHITANSYSYYVTFVRFCNVALWDISLYLVRWRTCVDIRLSDRHALAPRLRIIRSCWDGSPIMRPSYYLQKRISTRVKFSLSPHLKLSHRGGCGELAQDPRMQTAVWVGSLSKMRPMTVVFSANLRSLTDGSL